MNAARRPRPHRTQRRVGHPELAAVFGLVGVLVLLAVGFWSLVAPADDEGIEVVREAVPNVVGMERHEADEAVRRAGFQVVVVERQNSLHPPGTVFAQEPPGGVVIEAGSTIQIEVSLGDDWVLVPMVLGSMVEDAELHLRFDHGLEVRSIPEHRCDVTAGEVFGQVPLWERVTPGALVELRYAAPDRVEVPDLAGESPVEATATLEEIGFPVAQASAPSFSVPQGRVARTVPAAGSDADLCSTIFVVVSTGVPRTVVPDVVGFDAEEAVEAIRRAGLRAEVAHEELREGHDDDGKVLAQNIGGSTTVPRGTTVVITVGQAKQPDDDADDGEDRDPEDGGRPGRGPPDGGPGGDGDTTAADGGSDGDGGEIQETAEVGGDEPLDDLLDDES